jgi:hypothetical protein
MHANQKKNYLKKLKKKEKKEKEKEMNRKGRTRGPAHQKIPLQLNFGTKSNMRKKKALSSSFFLPPSFSIPQCGVFLQRKKEKRCKFLVPRYSDKSMQGVADPPPPKLWGSNNCFSFLDFPSPF